MGLRFSGFSLFLGAQGFEGFKDLRLQGFRCLGLYCRVVVGCRCSGI